MPATAALTLVVRRRAALPLDVVEGPGVISAAELGRRYGADPGDLELVRRVLTPRGLRGTSTDVIERTVVGEGAPAALAEVFGTRLSPFEGGEPFAPGRVGYGRHEGELGVPAELTDVVVSVLGLDPQPVASPQFHTLNGQPHIVYTPPELGRLYAFPAEADGAGQTLAIISLGGGYRQQDLDSYFAGLRLARPRISDVSVDGAEVNADLAAPSKFDLEVTLDLQIAGALAPGAHIVNYFTRNNGPGILKGLQAAIHADPPPTVISLSWGSPEETYSGQLGL